MPGDDYDLGALERRVPHVEFLMELFVDKDRKAQWDSSRIARFERVKHLMLKWWNDVSFLARQMAGDPVFQQMCRVLEQAVSMIRIVEMHISEASTRMSHIRRLMTWNPADEGRLIC